MKSIAFAVAALVLAAGAAIAAAPPAATAPAPGTATVSATAPYVLAAVADAGRPDADKARDVNRKPAEMLAFANIKPGDKIAEMIPGGGYFTRIFSKAIGSTGKLYTIEGPPPAATPGAPSRIAAIIESYGNIVSIREPYPTFSVPEPVDLVWTSQNYHDLRNNPATDMAAINKRAFAALKPGGIYIVLDHSAVDGAPTTTTQPLHRIDQGLVRRDVEAAGFVYVGESNVLRNPADVRTIPVRDGDIQGRTDQFIMKFRKP